MHDQFFQHERWFHTNGMTFPSSMQQRHESELCQNHYRPTSTLEEARNSKSVWSLPRPPEGLNLNSLEKCSKQFGSIFYHESQCKCIRSRSCLQMSKCMEHTVWPHCLRLADREPTVSFNGCGKYSSAKPVVIFVPYHMSESRQLASSCDVFRRLLPCDFHDIRSLHDLPINHGHSIHDTKLNLLHIQLNLPTQGECQNMLNHARVCGKGLGFVNEVCSDVAIDYCTGHVHWQFLEYIQGNQFPSGGVFTGEQIESHCCREKIKVLSKNRSFLHFVVPKHYSILRQGNLKPSFITDVSNPNCFSAILKNISFVKLITRSKRRCLENMQSVVSFPSHFIFMWTLRFKAQNDISCYRAQPLVFSQLCRLKSVSNYRQQLKYELCQYASLNHHNIFDFTHIYFPTIPWILGQVLLLWLCRTKDETRWYRKKTICRCRHIRNSRKRNYKKGRQPILGLCIVSVQYIRCRSLIHDIFGQYPHCVDPDRCYDTTVKSEQFSIPVMCLPCLSNNAVTRQQRCVHPWGTMNFQMHPRSSSHYRRKMYRRVAYIGQRVGEAKVPGPPFLDIGTFNPTQLLHKEEDVMAWGQGIYCASETSVTTAALKLLRPKFAKKGYHCAWSDPVEPIQPKRSQLRGKAAGVAIISSFPIRQYHEPITCPVQDTSRFIDGVIQVNPNCVLYAASLYGVASSSFALDPIAITNQLFNFAAERAVSFKGPALIAGDLNCYLTDIGVWENMMHQGWVDAAELDGLMFHRNPQPTSKDRVRKSFILMNRQLASVLSSCRTCDDHLFPTHPLLLAQCSLKGVLKPNLQWVLPKSVDSHMFDPDLMEKVACRATQDNYHRFARALENSPDKAAAIFASAVESTWKQSCVDTEGNQQYLQPGFFGRDRLCPLKMQPPAIPVVRKARDGDFEPGLAQPSVELRRHTRQLRRLESLLSQTKALTENNDSAKRKCQELWDAVLKATGFHKSFAHWMCRNFHFFVPLTLPPVEFIQELLGVFREWHQKELNIYFLTKMKRRKQSILLDISKGGSRCFEEVRDPAPAPQSYVVNQVSCRVKRVAWRKQGNRTLLVQDTEQLDQNLPVCFQGQQVHITCIAGNQVTLDKPVKLKHSNLLLTQKQITADPDQMHQITFDAWNQHWKRDHGDANDDQWDEILPYLHDLNPIPEMPFEPFTHELWDQHLRGLKTKTARGGCGFSAREMSQFPASLLTWLFSIFDNCEKGANWPSNWVLARVTMLAKTQQPHSAFDTRPITVFSILYRQWARIRSKQILKHMTSYMPKQVAMATSRIPADVAAAYVGLQVEEAINENSLLAGLGVDLKRCFNTLPRWPLILAMARLGIPQKYIAGWESMLRSMRRTLLIGGTQSAPQFSTTGAPEGCGFSVVAMAVMSWWQAQAMAKHVQEVRVFTYADNWNYIASTIRAVKKAIEFLEAFVKIMRMTISPEKSWLWATTSQGRKQLSDIKVNGIQIPVVTSYSDLGCDVQYSKQCKKPKQNKRWTKATRVCKRIGVSKTPRAFKEQMANSSAFAGATFGAPITYVPKTKWRQLRTAIAQTVRLTTAGASPWLALGSFLNDPQLRHICHAVRFWKRVLTTFPEVESIFNKYIVQQGVSKVGPVSSFLHTMNDADWCFHTPFVLKHQITGLKIPWRETSRKYTQYVLESQWDVTVSQAVQHRKDWSPARFDPHMFVKSISNRTPREVWILRTASSGKHYTYDIVCKYVAGLTDKCPFCEQKDHKKHRLLECKAFHDIRKKYVKTLKFVGNNHNFLYFGLPPKTPGVEQDVLQICQPWSSPRQARMEDLPKHLFLDGSAFGQEFKDTTISAWAIVEATYPQHDFHLIAKGFVPGTEQGSYRGEVMAIRVALDFAFHGVFYVDCQSAIDVYEQMQQAYKMGWPMPCVDHSDLWKPIWDIMITRPCYSVQLQKVKSHQETKDIQDPINNWIATGNNWVDKEAKSVIVCHPIYRKILHCVQKRQETQHHLVQYQNLMCEIADKSFMILKDQGQQARGVAECEQSRPSFAYLIPCQTKPPSSMISFDMLPKKCPYGRLFYDRFAAWFQKLEWPVNPAAGTMGFVSLIELYFNFVITTGTEAPISTASRGKPSNYQLLDQCITLQTKNWSLSQHTRVWCLFWNWCLKHQAFIDPPTLIEKRFIHHVGYNMQSSCVAGRPKFPYSESTYQALWSYFHQAEGPRRTTAAPLRPLPRP